ncbi:MAG: hypothetical protein R6U57_10055 [Anaerolineales bacterium]
MRKEEKLTRSLRNVEKKLAAALQPVEPNPTFISNLRLQIEEAGQHRARIKKVKKGILVAGGIVGILVMIITIIRSLTSWEKVTQSISKLISKEDREHQTASI